MNDLPPPPSADDRAASVADSAEAPLPAPASKSAELGESTAARSAYLYFVLLLSMIGMVVGGMIVTTSVVHVIAPDTGHRDLLDRAAVGFVEVAGDGVEIAREFLDAEGPTLEQFCGSDMDAACVDFYDQEYGSGAFEITDTVDDVLTSIQNEAHRQIRMASIGWLVVGLVLLSSSLLSFRYHARKSALYRQDGSEV